MSQQNFKKTHIFIFSSTSFEIQIRAMILFLIVSFFDGAPAWEHHHCIATPPYPIDYLQIDDILYQRSSSILELCARARKRKCSSCDFSAVLPIKRSKVRRPTPTRQPTADRHRNGTLPIDYHSTVSSLESAQWIQLRKLRRARSLDDLADSAVKLNRSTPMPGLPRERAGLQ